MPKEERKRLANGAEPDYTTQAKKLQRETTAFGKYKKVINTHEFFYISLLFLVEYCFIYYFFVLMTADWALVLLCL
jgi:hypothetical protein